MMFGDLLPNAPRPGDYGQWFASPSSSTKQDRKNKKRARQNRRKGRK